MKTPAHAPWSLVWLKDHTDVYRVYTYRGKRIYVGMTSDTVRDDESATVEKTPCTQN